MSVKRWLWCLAVGGVLACRGSGEDAAREAERQREASDAGTVLVRAGTKRPDGGVLPDGGRFRYQLEEVPPLEPGQCPPGQYPCCDGSCSPDKLCPGISCGQEPAMRE